MEGETADIVMGGHVFGDHLQQELDELLRVTKPGGVIILILGNIDKDNAKHKFLLDRGFKFSKFYRPVGLKRKYWLIK
ncbi:MAG: hypothetical protein LBN07_00005 [Christensenellaceae bacterium]|jgi:hypothetical protein|nr:hypothetical protein [Christensenellaceae bacterium]